jgi:hypothetical protein
MTQDARERHSFILRILREGKGQEWKGWVQHANSGEATFFHTKNSLCAFIERHQGEPAPPAPQDQTHNGSRRKSSLR